MEKTSPKRPFAFRLWFHLWAVVFLLGGLAFGFLQLYLAYHFARRIDSTLSVGLLVESQYDPFAVIQWLVPLVALAMLSGSATVALTMLLAAGYFYAAFHLPVEHSGQEEPT